MHPPDCCHRSSEPSCREDACIVVDEHHYMCATHAREILVRRRDGGEQKTGGAQCLFPFGLRALIRPLVDIHVILRDIEKPKGLIIVPKTALNKDGRIKGSTEFATGTILRTGPGYHQRTGAGGLSGLYTGERKPMYAAVGQHVAFRAKYESAVGEFRGLALVHDFDILGELLPESQDTAAQ